VPLLLLLRLPLLLRLLRRRRSLLLQLQRQLPYLRLSQLPGGLARRCAPVVVVRVRVLVRTNPAPLHRGAANRARERVQARVQVRAGGGQATVPR
jgi:hypothetical protein